MQLWDFLDMYMRISKDPCTEYLGTNQDTGEVTVRWPVFGWYCSCVDHQIWHTNHLFQVPPGGVVRYKHLTISGEHFVAEVFLKWTTWAKFHITSKKRFEIACGHEQYHLLYEGDLSTEWHSALTYWALVK